MRTIPMRFFLLPALLLSALPAIAGERGAVVVTEIRLDYEGDAVVSARVSGRPDAIPDRYRSDPMRVMRDAISRRDAARLERVTSSVDPADQSVVIGAVSPGMASSRRDRYEIDMPEDATVVHADPGIFITVHSVMMRGDSVVFVNKVIFPSGVLDTGYDPVDGRLFYQLPGRHHRPSSGRWGPDRDDHRPPPPPPPGHMDPMALVGRWEFMLNPQGGVAPNLPSIAMDLAPEGRGLGGSVTMDVQRNGMFVFNMRIKDCRIMGDRIIVSAHDEKRDGKTTLSLQFDLDGKIERGYIEGDTKYVVLLTGGLPTVTNMKMRFYKVR